MIREGISNVTLSVLGADTAAAENRPGTRTLLVRFRSDHTDKLHQVYLNGILSGVTHEISQRQLCVISPREYRRAIRIDIAAVSPGRAHEDFAHLFAGETFTARAVISLARTLAMPWRGTYQIFMNPEDENTPFSDRCEPLWCAPRDKSGFGLAKFGFAEFGIDAGAVPGFGVGAFGFGEFGYDAFALHRTSAELEPGAYSFAVRIDDDRGNTSLTQTNPVTIQY